MTGVDAKILDEHWRAFRAAASGEDQAKPAGVALKPLLALVREDALLRGLTGDVAGRKLSAAMDRALGMIFERIQGEIGAKGSLALVATGGYGRGVLAPWSDIDLLILHRGFDKNTLKKVIDGLLYPLWDAGLTVGHGVHTVDSAFGLAKKDLSTRTAYLDHRFLAGDSAIVSTFREKYEQMRLKTLRQFVTGKVAEQAERRRKYSPARRSVEPDVKAGRGGLRDIDTVLWLFKYKYGEDLWSSSFAASILHHNDVKALRKALRFMQSVRMHIHLARGRGDDRLTFDLQPDIAERLGYAERPDANPAERLLRHYFVHVDNVVRISRIAVTRFEEAEAGVRQKGQEKIPKALMRDEVDGAVNARLRGKRLDFANPRALTKGPTDAFRLFRAQGKKEDLRLHPDALAEIQNAIPRFSRDGRDDPVIAETFLNILTKSISPLPALRSMAESGLLAWYLPMFARLNGRFEYGLYRRFSLEENVFQAVEALAELRTGELIDEHPIATGIVGDKRREAVFFLSVLFHEARWAQASRSEWAQTNRSAPGVERLVKRLAKRFQLSETDLNDVAWIAAQPTKLRHIVERRDMARRSVITGFAAEVGSLDRLNALLVVTVCHMRVVNPGAWTEWIATRLTALYHATAAFLADGEAGLDEWLEQGRRRTEEQLAVAAPDWTSSRRADFLDQLAGETTASLPPRVLGRATDLIDAADGRRHRAAVSAHLEGDWVEATVLAPDRSGLLADLSGALAALGVSVRLVKAIPLSDDRVLDIFVLRPNESSSQEETARLLPSLEKGLLAAAVNPPAKPAAPKRILGDRRKIFSVPVRVTLDTEAADDALLVEAEGRDRPGLLHDLTRTLSDIGVVIKSAHIVTYGERVVDSFYVQDAPGYKITNQRRLQTVERRVRACLAED